MCSGTNDWRSIDASAFRMHLARARRTPGNAELRFSAHLDIMIVRCAFTRAVIKPAWP